MQQSLPNILRRGQVITLRFQDGEVQSRMRTDLPDELVLTYTRTMIAFMLLNGTPKHIAMIGLGGGSMVKWCHRHLTARLTVIEINPEVIDLRDEFQIPADDNRLSIVCADGADYVATTTDTPDVLLIDGFDHRGQPPQLMSQIFYNNCHRTLATDGLLISNLCGPTEVDMEEALTNIRASFEGRIQHVVPEDGENRIVVAIKGRRLPMEEEPTENYLKRFQQIYQQISPSRRS